jgi:hypothetical protein
MMEIGMRKLRRERRKSQRGKKDQRALIILVQHSSRLARELWMECGEKNADVVCSPAHRSHLVHQLHLGPNAALKKRLEKAPPIPSKRCLKSKLPIFLLNITLGIYGALDQVIIRHGFKAACITSENIDHVLKKCPTITGDSGRRCQK